MSIKVITGPTVEPLSLAETKLHLRVDADFTDDDSLINGLIVAARQAAERETGRALMTQTLELALDEFPCEVDLERAPLQTLSSVKYVDINGVLQTMSSSDYVVDDYKQPSRILRAFGVEWPETRVQANAVLVRFVAGYANAAAVPQEIKQWMLLQIGSMYENRESIAAGRPFEQVPFTDFLLDAYRIWGL